MIAETVDIIAAECRPDRLSNRAFFFKGSLTLRDSTRQRRPDRGHEPDGHTASRR
jgi:hypothetical protein